MRRRRNVALTFDPGALRNPPLTSGLEGITSFASPSTVLSQTQDGYAAGSLVGVEIDEEGVMNARYSNGRTFQGGRDPRQIQSEGRAPAGGREPLCRESGVRAGGAR